MCSSIIIQDNAICHSVINNFFYIPIDISAALMLISICTLLKMPNPLNPMQILWINVIMDGPPARSLGLEPADPGVLKKPPRSTKEQILTRSLLTNIVLSAFVIIIGTMWVHKVNFVSLIHDVFQPLFFQNITVYLIHFSNFSH